MTVISCIVMAVLVIAALVMINIRSTSSPSNEMTKRGSSLLNGKKMKEEDGHLSKKLTTTPAIGEPIKSEPENDVLVRVSSSMTDQDYRRALQAFKGTDEGDMKEQKKPGMNDEEYRNALQSMGMKHNKD
jgi:hypothetical protein